MPDLGPSPYDSIPIDAITVEGVANFQGPKTHGADKIPAQLLKETAVNIAPILTLVFKASLHQCTLPQDWKSAHAFSIFKKSSANVLMPISLTSIPCRVFGHIIYSSIYKHLDKSSMLCDAQHSFRENHSCETQLITTITFTQPGSPD